MRLAILSTHPIQYYAPLFRELHQGPLDIHVFYGWEGMARKAQVDHGFGASVQWDIPLLDGYPHTFLENRSKDPGTHHFRGIDAADAIDRISEWKPDALLVFGWNYRSHLRALRHFSGKIPILFRGDSTLLNERPGIRRVLRRLFLTWIYRHIDIALYVGQHNRRYFQKHGLRKEQLAWAPHAIDNDRFARDSENREAEAISWRRDLGIADDDRVALFAGKLEDNKQPELLLDAFLSFDHEHAHLVFVGTGPLEDKLRSVSRGSRNVHFLGFQNQSRMPTVYRLGDVYVLPSQRETWGLGVNEAMACRRPVVVSDHVGCAPDLVIEGKSGWSFPAGDLEALSSILRRAIDGPSKLSAMGEFAEKLIASWSITEEGRCIEGAVFESEGSRAAV